MKIVFFIALLTNIIFFLWEFNSGAFNPKMDTKYSIKETKQIFLLSELSSNDEKNKLIVAENNVDLNVQFVSADSNSETIDSINQAIEMASTSIKVKPEDSVASDNQLVNDDNELTTLQHYTDNLNTTHQTDKPEKQPALEEKTLNDDYKDNSGSNSLSENNHTIIKQAGYEKNNCYQVGPFRNTKALYKWRQLNKINADLMSQFKKERQVVTSYLVYYPAADTFTQSRKNIQLLKRMGITDYWLFRKGELKGAISLGLFSKEKRAFLLKEKLINMGLDVEIKQRHKKASVVFAQILTKEDAFKETIVISDKQSVSECENNTE